MSFGRRIARLESLPANKPPPRVFRIVARGDDEQERETQRLIREGMTEHDLLIVRRIVSPSGSLTPPA